MVTFKDSVAARVNPQHTIRKPDGTPWRDKKGLPWVNPYDREIWEYNIRVAEELSRAGFDEIQFDYIRFPEPYKSLPPQVFPGAGTTPKPALLAEFLKTACPRIRALGARCTADIFGLVTTVPGALEVGQEWEVLAPVTDVLLPMVYPSHYPHGSFGLPHPNAEPYRVVNIAISKAHQRNLRMSSGGNSGSQATSLITRAMALKEIRLYDWWKVLLREIPSGLMLGGILGVIGIIRILTWQQAGFYDYGSHYRLVAITVGAALVGIVTFGSLAGSMLPFVLRRLGFDPASASAPFVATLVDVTGLSIYFTVAYLILHGTLL